MFRRNAKSGRAEPVTRIVTPILQNVIPSEVRNPLFSSLFPLRSPCPLCKILFAYFVTFAMNTE